MKNLFIIYYYIVGVVLILYGCDSFSCKRYPRYADFPETRTLSQAKAISCDRVYLRYPYRVEIKDSLAVILDLHPGSCFFHAFTYPEWRYVTSFGKRGEGPEDILLAERVRVCSPDSVWVLDSNRSQITRWRISVLSGKAERVEEISLDERLLRTLDFCKTDGGFLVTDYTGNYRYHVLDAHGQIKKSVGSIPSERSMDDSGKTALAQAWRSFIDYNPKNGVLAMVTQLGEVIEIFNLKTGEHKVCYGPGGEPRYSISQSEAIPKGIKGFNEVVVTDSCIYAVFDGISFKDRITAFRSDKKLPEGGRHVYVYSLTGKQKARIELFNSAFGLSVLREGLLTTSTDADVPLYAYQ